MSKGRRGAGRWLTGREAGRSFPVLRTTDMAVHRAFYLVAPGARLIGLISLRFVSGSTKDRRQTSVSARALNCRGTARASSVLREIRGLDHASPIGLAEQFDKVKQPEAVTGSIRLAAAMRLRHEGDKTRGPGILPSPRFYWWDHDSNARIGMIFDGIKSHGNSELSVFNALPASSRSRAPLRVSRALSHVLWPTSCRD